MQPIYADPNRCWEKLRRRYSSTRLYQNRSVINKFLYNKKEFEEWLIDKGMDVKTSLAQYEAIRFVTPDGYLGIVWNTGAGNLLAHDLGIQFGREKVK